MARIEIEVGGDLRQAAADVVEAWNAARAERPAPPSDRIVFRDWATLCAVLTPKRFDLLLALGQRPEDGVRALARRLGRDVKRVHGDVIALEAIGLVLRSESGALSLAADEISSTIRIAA